MTIFSWSFALSIVCVF